MDCRTLCLDERHQCYCTRCPLCRGSPRTVPSGYCTQRVTVRRVNDAVSCWVVSKLGGLAPQRGDRALRSSSQWRSGIIAACEHSVGAAQLGVLATLMLYAGP